MADGDLDHLVYATPDVDASVADLEARFGIRPTSGGRHMSRGTRNALIALSEFSYLEIIGPDPEQEPPIGPRWFGIDTLAEPRIVTWAIQVGDVERVMGDAARAGVALGALSNGSRHTADGATLRWRVTNPDVMLGEGLVPFLIDWGASPHPASSAARGLTLLSLRGEHPEPTRVSRAIGAVGATLPVSLGRRPGLVATLRTPRGEVQLR